MRRPDGRREVVLSPMQFLVLECIKEYYDETKKDEVSDLPRALTEKLEARGRRIRNRWQVHEPLKKFTDLGLLVEVGKAFGRGRPKSIFRWNKKLAEGIVFVQKHSKDYKAIEDKSPLPDAMNKAKNVLALLANKFEGEEAKVSKIEALEKRFAEAINKAHFARENLVDSLRQIEENRLIVKSDYRQEVRIKSYKDNFLMDAKNIYSYIATARRAAKARLADMKRVEVRLEGVISLMKSIEKELRTLLQEVRGLRFGKINKVYNSATRNGRQTPKDILALSEKVLRMLKDEAKIIFGSKEKLGSLIKSLEERYGKAIEVREELSGLLEDARLLGFNKMSEMLKAHELTLKFGED